jgi:copper(I)-binding protein
MKRRLVPLALALAACVAAQAQPAAPVLAEAAWARPIVPGQASSGAYMTLTAREPLTLIGAESPAAGIVEIHQMQMEGDVMKMRAADQLPLEPGKPLKLAPGGYHFMLMDLKAPFKACTQIAMTLRFRDATGKVATLRVPVAVQPRAPSDRR